MVRYAIATCKKCEHRIYEEDNNHKRNSYIDSSGNNEYDYEHIKCPTHKLKIIQEIIVYKCEDCSVLIEKKESKK